MKTAIVTGASSGIGKEFVHRLSLERSIDEIWVIARRESRLNELKNEIGKPVFVLPLDLTDSGCLDEYAKTLENRQPDVSVLVNCSGYGKFGSYEEIPVTQSLDMIDLNVKALVYITETTLPYMKPGSRIIQLDSCAAFQPLPRLNVYAATKAFVLSYTRALNEELKPRKIHAIAVCPGWVNTEFIDNAKSTVGENGGAVKYFKNISEASDVVKKALKDSKNPKKSISVYSFGTKAQHIATKLFPSKTAIFFWKRQQKM